MPDVPCSQGVVPRDSVPAVQWRAAGGKGAQDDEVSAAALVVSHVWILQFAYAVAAAITSLHVPIFGSTLWACRDGVYVDLGFFQGHTHSTRRHARTLVLEGRRQGNGEANAWNRRGSLPAAHAAMVGDHLLVTAGMVVADGGAGPLL
jgi:hypothetical protein